MRNFVPTEQQAETAKKKIAKYLKKYGTDVIQTVMPQNVWTIRQRTKGQYAYNPLTGAHDWWSSYRSEYNTAITIPSCCVINWIYTHYDPTLNVVCFGFVTLNTYANQGDNDKRRYTWVDPQYVFFMVDGEKSIYNSNGEHVPSDYFRYIIKYSSSNYPYSGSSYAFWNHAVRQTHYMCQSWDGIIQYIKNSPYSLLVGSDYNERININAYSIGVWSQASIVPQRTVKCAEEIESLLNSPYELSDDELMAHPFLFTLHQYQSKIFRYYDSGLWCAEQQGDVAILHYYDRPNNTSNVCNYDVNTQPPPVPWKRIETLRVFVTPKHVHVYRRSNDQWVRDTHINSIKYIPYHKSYFINLDVLWTCERFKYIKTIGQQLQGCTGQIIPDYWIQKILSLITQPILEALAKIGCYTTVGLLQDENQIQANIKRYFGHPCKAKSPLKQLGLSVKQLRILEQYYTTSKARPWSDLAAAPKLIKEAYAHQRADSNKLDVSYLSEQTFTTALQQIQCLHEFTSLKMWYFRDETLKPFYHTLMPALNLTLDEQEKLWNKYWHLSQKYPGHHILRTIKDTISTYSRLDLANRVPIDWNFNDIQQLEATHNNLIALLEAQQAERQRLHQMQQEERNKELEIKMKKYEEQRKQLEYSDGIYSIVMPKKLAEITHEGSFLHHCVGGYIQSHATGSTTILFLRRNDDIDTPWFTVEVRNQTIVQIHGKYNAWLGSSDESFAAVPFIMRWIKKNQLLCASHILTETARGYSSTGTCRELPVIDE